MKAIKIEIDCGVTRRTEDGVVSTSSAAISISLAEGDDRTEFIRQAVRVGVSKSNLSALDTIGRIIYGDL